MINNIPELEKEIAKKIGKKPKVNIFAAGVVDSHLAPQLVDFKKNILDSLSITNKDSGVILGKTFSVPVCGIWEDTDFGQGVQVGTNADDFGRNSNLKAIIVPYGGTFSKDYFGQESELYLHGKLFPNKLKETTGVTFGNRETINKIIKGIEKIAISKKVLSRL